jgi:type I restriction-modification system DNA methylase subunit
MKNAEESTMTDTEHRLAAKQFAADWQGRGDEKQETQTFWLALLQKVYGVTEPDKFISFEKTVNVDNVKTGKSNTKFIDGYIGATRVLIEQKGAKIDLNKGELQSDGSLLSPYQQARRYGGYLPVNQQPRWIVVCNFKEFRIHDMNHPNDTPEILLLSDLEKEYARLNFLVNTGDENIRKEMEISLQAGELVGVLYDALLKQYAEPESEQTLKSLNALCVRLVFCLYAEDSGIFGKRNMFHDYLQAHRAEDRRALINLFRVLDQKEDERDRYLDDDLAAFPYVNGGLFANEDIEIPRLGDEIIDLLLSRASEDFDWSAISPTIFGAVFESTLNPQTRRSGGMHYTSIENIHKVIDPLFLDALKTELNDIKSISVKRNRDAKLRIFQTRLASLTFLDPACGSGNFLTETYLSLRRLENEVLSLLYEGQIVMDMNDPIQVSISQFYGIEINDFAVTVAKTALWIAESQMMKETEDVVRMSLDFLPLKTNAHIVEGNALQMDWEDVVSKMQLNYIMGNPPFIGYTYQSTEQKADLQNTMAGIGKNIDYVSGWYFKAAQLMQSTAIRTAFVSTNSITQGEQVAGVWKPMFECLGIHIDFAHRTFRWDSEANLKAHVHCVIVGFSVQMNPAEKLLFTSKQVQHVQNISPYLIDAPTLFIESRNKPLCNVPEICKGSQPTDGGNLIVTEEDYNGFMKQAPASAKYIRRFLGADEFLNGKNRYCLWLDGISPKELQGMPLVLERVQLVRDFRLSSKKAATRKQADTPTLFTENRQPSEDFIAIPEVSSGTRRYIPMGFLHPDTICSNKLQILPGASIYHFGVLMSNVHMAWMRTVCGRLKSDYDYSAKIVYNNFPWPVPTEKQKAKIEQSAQAILDARALYPDCSLAVLYNEVTMPPELRKAHQVNDRAVMEAYGFWGKFNSESACVAELMKMYQQLASN